MNNREAPEEIDPILGELFDEWTTRLQNGESLDVDECLLKYPEHAQALRSLLPAIEGLVAIGQGSAAFKANSPHVNLEAPRFGQLGDFLLVREIGRGGMGIVYEAQQISLNRRVALKVLPFATSLDAKQLQRFKNEAQAAACLHHQHIVSVYGVGCERGVHFYAMQFIEGHTLADLIADLRERRVLESGERPPAAATATLTGAAALTADLSGKTTAVFRAVARLGVQAARGLEHAHQLGVVHRDIKPANLLVDQRGDLWITDFGLAHCQSQVGLTMTGDLVGTLRYMSPEQAIAAKTQIDQRVDIYSLGATLYELLTLQPPFEGSDRRELLRQICFEEPRALRKLNRDVPEELEIIVLKALAKAPADRYATAQELADDLDRFLDHKPIRARRPTVVQRLRKLARRHRGVTATAGIAAGLLLVLGIAFLFYRNSLIANQRDEADKLRRLAEERFQDAREAVDLMYTQFAKKWLAQQPQMEPVEREFLNKALIFYEKLAVEVSKDPRVRLDTAQANVRVAEIQHNLGEFEQAEKAYNRAVPLLQGLVDEFPAVPEYQRELAQALHSLGILWGDTGRLPEEEKAHLRALSFQKKLVEDFPASTSYRRDLARGLYHLGCKHTFTGRWDTGAQFLSQAAALQQVLATELPGVPEIRAELADSLVRLNREEPLRKALNLFEDLLKESPGQPAYRNSQAEAYYFLSMWLSGAEAEAAIRKAIAIQEKLQADFPKVVNNSFDLVRSYFTLARILSRRNTAQAAIDEYRKGLKVAAPLLEIPKVDYLRQRISEGVSDLAELLEAVGRREEAEVEFCRSIVIQEKLVADFPKNEFYRSSLDRARRRLKSLQARGAERRESATSR